MLYTDYRIQCYSQLILSLVAKIDKTHSLL